MPDPRLPPTIPASLLPRMTPACISLVNARLPSVPSHAERAAGQLGTMDMASLDVTMDVAPWMSPQGASYQIRFGNIGAVLSELVEIVPLCPL